jgi:6-phosphogluconolactonase
MIKYSKIIVPVSLAVLLSCSAYNENLPLLITRHAHAGENGLYVYYVNKNTGTVKEIAESEAGPNPDFICNSIKRKLIYTINEVSKFNNIQGGGLTTIKYEGNNFQKISELRIPKGGPCHISISPGEDYLLIASYGSGSAAVVRLDENGIPESVTDTIVYEAPGGKESHPHMITFDPAGRKVYLTDLGLDRIMVYDLDKTSGRLIPVQDPVVNLPEGSGPRHLVFNRDGSKLYVINELNSTILAFKIDENGNPAMIQSVSAVDKNFKGSNYSAEIHIGMNEDFLYGSNRGENTIVVFRIKQDGLLELAGRTKCEGNWPNSFAIDPSGMNMYLAYQKSDSVSVLKINGNTGIPVPTGHQVKISAPACVRFLSRGKS